MIFLVGKMCSVFKVSRAGFYKLTISSPSNRSIENQIIEAEVLQAFENSKKAYGSPRITLELRKKSIRISRTRVVRIIRKAKLISIVTTDSSHNFPVSDNVLGAVWVLHYLYQGQARLAVSDNGDRSG